MLDLLTRLRDIVIALALAWVGVSAAETGSQSRGAPETATSPSHTTSTTLSSAECQDGRPETLRSLDSAECTR